MDTDWVWVCLDDIGMGILLLYYYYYFTIPISLSFRSQQWTGKVFRFIRALFGISVWYHKGKRHFDS